MKMKDSTMLNLVWDLKKKAYDETEDLHGTALFNHVNEKTRGFYEKIAQAKKTEKKSLLPKLVRLT